MSDEPLKSSTPTMQLYTASSVVAFSMPILEPVGINFQQPVQADTPEQPSKGGEERPQGQEQEKSATERLAEEGLRNAASRILKTVATIYSHVFKVVHAGVLKERARQDFFRKEYNLDKNTNLSFTPLSEDEFKDCISSIDTIGALLGETYASDAKKAFAQTIATGNLRPIRLRFLLARTKDAFKDTPLDKYYAEGLKDCIEAVEKPTASDSKEKKEEKKDKVNTIEVQTNAQVDTQAETKSKEKNKEQTEQTHATEHTEHTEHTEPIKIDQDASKPRRRRRRASKKTTSPSANNAIEEQSVTVATDTTVVANTEEQPNTIEKDSTQTHIKAQEDKSTIETTKALEEASEKIVVQNPATNTPPASSTPVAVTATATTITDTFTTSTTTTSDVTTTDNNSVTNTTNTTKKKKGWPKGKPRKPRTENVVPQEGQKSAFKVDNQQRVYDFGAKGGDDECSATVKLTPKTTVKLTVVDQCGVKLTDEERGGNTDNSESKDDSSLPKPSRKRDVVRKAREVYTSASQIEKDVEDGKITLYESIEAMKDDLASNKLLPVEVPFFYAVIEKYKNEAIAQLEEEDLGIGDDMEDEIDGKEIDEGTSKEESYTTEYNKGNSSSAWERMTEFHNDITQEDY